MYSSPKELYWNFDNGRDFCLFVFESEILYQNFIPDSYQSSCICYKAVMTEMKGDETTSLFFFRCFNHSSIHLNCERVVWI